MRVIIPVVLLVVGIGASSGMASGVRRDQCARPLSSTEMATIRGGDGLFWGCVDGTGSCAENCLDLLNGQSTHVTGNPFASCQWLAGLYCGDVMDNNCTRHYHESSDCSGPYSEVTITKKGC